MGMPAARASIDKAAHDGPIQCGSPDVIIGGFPAARKGDSFSCTQHGSGIIVGGSGSVLVNGVSLARQGDKTQCNAGGASAPAKPKPAAPQYWGGSLAKKAGEDGMLHGEHYDAYMLGAYASLKDNSNDGSYDTVSSGFVLEDLTLRIADSDDLLKGELNNKIAQANVSGSYYNGGGDIYGINTSAKATGMQYGITGSAGKEDTLYGTANASVTLATAEANLIAEVYTGNQGRYGINLEGGAEATAVKEKAERKVNLYGIAIAKAKAEVNLGGVGASASLAAYKDDTDHSFNFKASGKFSYWLGLGTGVDLKIFIEPLRKLFFGKDEHTEAGEKSGGGEGSIIDGCKTVLIGN